MWGIGVSLPRYLRLDWYDGRALSAEQMSWSSALTTVSECVAICVWRASPPGASLKRMWSPSRTGEPSV